MIVRNGNRTLPTDWTHGEIAELIDHVNDLRAHGNPSGFFVSSELAHIQPSWPIEDTEYEACRVWIEDNLDMVRTAWQFEVRPDW